MELKNYWLNKIKKNNNFYKRSKKKNEKLKQWGSN